MHGFDLSEKKTPRSRASCSSVTGRKEPCWNQIFGEWNGGDNGVWYMLTNAYDGEDLGGDGVGVPAVELLLGGGACVFAFVAG